MHETPHKINGYCQCMCDDCYTENGCECSEGCAHNLPPKPLPSAYDAKPEEKPTHVCRECGKEVFRKGTRGRFPSLCEECK